MSSSLSRCERFNFNLGTFFFGVPILKDENYKYLNTREQVFTEGSTDNFYSGKLELNRTQMIVGLAISAIGLVIGALLYTNHLSVSLNGVPLTQANAYGMMVSSAVFVGLLPLLLVIQKAVRDYLLNKANDANPNSKK